MKKKYEVYSQTEFIGEKNEPVNECSIQIDGEFINKAAMDGDDAACLISIVLTLLRYVYINMKAHGLTKQNYIGWLMDVTTASLQTHCSCLGYSESEINYLLTVSGGEEYLKKYCQTSENA